MTMTTSIFEFNMGRLGTKMATRPNGQAFLEDVLTALAKYDAIVLNFDNRAHGPDEV